MGVPEALEELIMPVVEGLGYQLLGIVEACAGRRRVVRVYIDSEDGISVKDCEKVSHHVSDLLDVEAPIRGSYVLEVSSPGLDRPLFKARDYARFSGHRIKVRTAGMIEGRRNLVGKLVGIDDVGIQLQVDEQILHIPLDGIERARVIPEF